MKADDPDAPAFYDAHMAAPELDIDRLRLAIDAYLVAMHLHIRSVHADTPLTAEQAMDAFRPRDEIVEF